MFSAGSASGGRLNSVSAPILRGARLVAITPTTSTWRPACASSARRCPAPATRRRRSARCTCSTGHRTSPTSRRSPATPPSGTTCGSGPAPRGGGSGGHPADWLAAGTYDRAVGLSLMTLQVTHKESPDIDAERDHTVTTLLEANPTVTVDLIRHFSSGYHSRNGGGDAIVTDGNLPVVDARALHADATAAMIEPTSGRDRPRPDGLRGRGGVGPRLVRPLRRARHRPRPERRRAVPVGCPWERRGQHLGDHGRRTRGVRRHGPRARHGHLPRTQLGAHRAHAVLGGADRRRVRRPGVRWAWLTLGAGLPAVALGILVLLALTSHRSRDYATRAKARGRPVVGPQPPASARVDGVPTASALPHQRSATTSDETRTSPGRRARRD